MCLPLWLMVSGSPDASLHRSLFICLPVWPVVSPILASVVWLSRCLSLRVFLHVFPTLASGVRLSGCLLFAFTWLPSFVSYHLSPDSSVSQLICLQSSVCLSGGVWFFRLFAFVRVFLPIHMSPLVALSCSCFIAISLVIGPYLCSFLLLCLLVVSGATPA